LTLLLLRSSLLLLRSSTQQHCCCCYAAALLLLCSSLLLLRSSTAAAAQQHRPLARTNIVTNKQTNKHPGTTIRLTLCERDAIKKENLISRWSNGSS